jgi:pyridoxal phosphate enzyme (YggS family)
MGTIKSAIQGVTERIRQAAITAGRDPESISLLAVSKTFPAENVREAWQAGQLAFGENYVQEGVDKIAELADLPLHWHFIGPLQSNKTRPVAENFDWVHSIERLKIAERLSAQRPAHLPPLQVCIQVNVSGEVSKSGCEFAGVPALGGSDPPIATPAVARPDVHSRANRRRAATARPVRGVAPMPATA